MRLRDLPLPALAGRHQIGNAATALAALAVGDFGVELTHARRERRRCATCASPGGFSVVPGEVEWILDVAHNVPAARDPARQSAAPAARAARSPCAASSATRTSAASPRRSPREIDAWILVTLAGPRAVSAQQLAAQLAARCAVDLAHAADVAEACRAARAAARPGDRVLVFGSFLTVGPALEFLGL